MDLTSNNNKNNLDSLRLALSLALYIFALGLAFSLLVRQSGLSSLNIYGNSFHVLYVRNETGIFILLFLALLLARSYLLGNHDFSGWPSPLRGDQLARSPWLWVTVLTVVLLAWRGNYLVLHDFPLSNDEFLPRFQAQIFLAGKIKALLPLELREFGKALTPIFAIFDPQEGTWVSAYLPIYAGLRTGFLALGVESLTGPAMAGLSLVLIAAVARRLWPHESLAPFIAVVLLASSTQFLVTSMTSYTYPAHLCFNLAWLYFYCRSDRLGYLVTPWIGFLALGLHNPFIHALFVAPFLLALVWRRNWRLTLYFGLVYGAGCILWYLWWTRLVVLKSSDMSAFQVPGLYQLIIQPMNLSMLFAWQSLALTVLAFLSLIYWKNLMPFLKILALGCLLTFGFFFFFYLDQVLGWGYRFFYGVLGSLVLLAVAGWFHLKESLGFRKAWGFLVLGTALAMLVQFPIRCLQVESFIRPFARSAQYIQSLPYSFVIIDPTKVWFAQLLVRNDPFLRDSAKILFAPLLDEAQLAKLMSLGKVHIVRSEELAQFGLHPMKLHHDSP
ncbi:MAG: hypothetical protein M1438_14970 [Deltaproteobacteria bacterium]|nr:hypothetical protein [Deltaproteobacteria bacterium]